MQSITSLSSGSQNNDQTQAVTAQSNAASFSGRRPSAPE